MAAVGDTGGLTWTLEPSHFPAAPTRWGAEIAVTRQTQVLTRVFAEAGLPIETLGFREFDGRVYTTIVPLGGKARKPPPKVLLPVLLKVVPELRKRVATSRSWAADDRPTQIIDEWLGGKERKLRTEGRRLIAIDADSLSGPKLADLIDEVFAYATDAWYWHFRLHAAGVWHIGVLGRELEQRPRLDRHRVRAALHRPLRREHRAGRGAAADRRAHRPGARVVRRSSRRPRSTTCGRSRRRCGVRSTTTSTRMASARCATRSPTRPSPSDPSGC